jgi:PKHD-type hydroxylase
MLLEIENLLDTAELARVQRILAAAPWADGRATAGYQSAKVKNNLQLPDTCEEVLQSSKIVMDALARNPLFQSAALPRDIFPPLFNLYREGHGFGTHVDNALRPWPGDSHRRMRTDLSATLFLGDPDSYDGGELVIEDTYGSQTIKLNAGSMILYPATSLHQVTPVRRGERLASFFWIQSYVADDARRSILFDMDASIQNLRTEHDDNHPALVALTGCYHNLLRLWSAA